MRWAFKNKSGSVQVVEMSFVFPVAMAVVLCLIYLAFAMFLYVHINSTALLYLDELDEHVGEEGLYWQLLGEYITDESLKEVNVSLKDELNKYALLPGIGFDSSCSVVGKNHSPKACVNITTKYFGKQVFNISVEKDVIRPKDFAETVDFGLTLAEDFEELKSIYDKFF